MSQDEDFLSIDSILAANHNDDHYSDVIMSAIASQIIEVLIVFSVEHCGSNNTGSNGVSVNKKFQFSVAIVDEEQITVNLSNWTGYVGAADGRPSKSCRHYGTGYFDCSSCMRKLQLSIFSMGNW